MQRAGRLPRPCRAAARIDLAVADDQDHGGGVGDPGIFAWSLRWTPFAIGRQVSPLFSDYLNHPDGINLMWNTWVPLPGLLLSPLTLAFGPVLTFNVLLTLAYGLSAWSAYLAILRTCPTMARPRSAGSCTASRRRWWPIPTTST